MAIRYEGTNDEPDLVLVAGNSNATGNPLDLGDLTTLLAWHTADPVSQEEIARHNAVVGFQGNVNPFIACADQIDVSHLWR